MRRVRTHRWIKLAGILACLGAAANQTGAQTTGGSPITVQYAEVDGRPLLLDLHLPDSPGEAPLIVYIHGGAWRSGSRTRMPLGRLVQGGFAVASVDYRLSIEARFPAQVHDIKAAIRFLRAHDASYSYESRRIGIAGSSAGGHLAALVGVTNGHASLEGTVGNHAAESSDVQAAVSYFGATNLLTILAQSTPHGLKVRAPALKLLLGASPLENDRLARVASPVQHVDAGDPPLYLLHGDQDPQMPINQAHELQGAFQRAGLQVRFDVLHGEAHGGEAFYDAARSRSVGRFLSRHLR